MERKEAMSNTLCLFYKNKTTVKNNPLYILIVDYDKREYTLYDGCVVPQEENAIEVKRKIDIREYAEGLDTLGFSGVELWGKSA